MKSLVVWKKLLKILTISVIKHLSEQCRKYSPINRQGLQSTNACEREHVNGNNIYLLGNNASHCAAAFRPITVPLSVLMNDYKAKTLVNTVNKKTNTISLSFFMIHTQIVFYILVNQLLNNYKATRLKGSLDKRYILEYR